jgi:alkylated DNA repair dioxygenase AlkB
VKPQVAWQGSLFDAEETAADASYGDLRRIQLDDRSWVDYAPGWLRGSDALFADLVETGRWQQREVHMYDRTLLEPRLTAGWSTDVEEVPAPLRAIAQTLSERYAVGFDRIWVNLYRNGADSVAWHGDRNRLVMTNPLVATVSLGARRRFLLRPRGTSKAVHELRPGIGDLVDGPRMSVTIRHSQPAQGERWLKEPTSKESGHAW